jgi:hypothetical protein
MLAIVINRKRKYEDELEKDRFERDMLIGNPSMYQEYMKQKDREEAEGVQWSAPESIEEIRDIDAILAKSRKQFNENISEEEAEADKAFVEQINSMSLFNNIDIDQIGDE